MTKTAKKEAKRQPLQARPDPEADRKAIRADIVKRFSKSFEHLAK
jgi:hypothetical protein